MRCTLKATRQSFPWPIPLLLGKAGKPRVGASLPSDRHQEPGLLSVLFLSRRGAIWLNYLLVGEVEAACSSQ